MLLFPDEDKDTVTVAILTQESKSYFNFRPVFVNETGLTDTFAGWGNDKSYLAQHQGWYRIWQVEKK